MPTGTSCARPSSRRGAETIWVTHGREDALVYWSQQQGLEAEPLSIEAYEEGEEEEGE